MSTIISIRSLPIMLLMLLLAACGGGGGGGGGGQLEPPLAIASADTTQVNAGEDSVSLDGSDSSSPNGSITTWQWQFLSQPEGSEADITGADTAQASFTPDLPGEYVVLLTVNDGEADSEDSQDARVTVTAVNPNPVAMAPAAISWILGTVQLDGSQSLPPEGGDAQQLVYEWELAAKPEGSEAELDGNDLVYPRFTADLVGTYQTRLVVKYGERSSQPVMTEINIVEANAPPMAKVVPLEGPITRGDTVTLDGSVSEDADGDPLQYRWRFTYRPPGSSAVLSGADTAKVSFVADVKNSYTLQLCVFDGVSRHCRITSVSRNLIELPEGAENTPPVAVITADTWNNKTFEAERGEEMRLGEDAYDIDYDSLTMEWSFVSYPDGYDPEANSNLDGGWSSGFTPTVDGDYVLKLTVSDGQASHSTTQTYTARLGANRAPISAAGIANGNPTTLVGTAVILDGEGSSDPDDNQLTYQWVLQQKPDNSQAELQDADTAHPRITPDQPGPYVISLEVADEHGWTTQYAPGQPGHEVVVLAKASNHAPVTRIDWGQPRAWYESSKQAGYDADQPFAITNKTRERHYSGETHILRTDYVRLSADSYDPDGDTLSHLWTLVSEAPEGNRMEVSDGHCHNGQGYTAISEETWEEYKERVETYTEWTCNPLGIAPTKAGLYVLEYQVYDGSEFAGPYTVAVHAVVEEDYPSLLLQESDGPGKEDGSDLTIQEFFPYQSRDGGLSVYTYISAEADEIPAKYFRLTAFDGDYTLTDIQLHSDDSDHAPKFMDITNNQEITGDYVIEEGSSIVVGFIIPFGLSSPEYDGSQAGAKLNDAHITGSFRIAEKEGWTVTMQPIF